MRFFHVFLAVFLVMSCNDSDKKEIVDSSKSSDEVVDVDRKDDEKKRAFQEHLANLCWGGGREKLNGNEVSSVSVPNRSDFSATKDGKLSLKLTPIKKDGSGLEDSNPEVLADNTPYTYIDNKITFEKDGNKMEIIVTEHESSRMTWKIQSKVSGKDFVREITWLCQ